MGLFSKKSTSPSLPSLSDEQKIVMKELMDGYYAASDKFVYDGTARRQCYAYTSSGKITTSSLKNCRNENKKYYLNCGLFAQMVWMGRAISDFKNTPSTLITKAFGWGYYFDFLMAQNAFGVKKKSGAFYKGNTYEGVNGTCFVSFDNAAAMAAELYYKGFEIPYSECEIGDLVFYRSDSISDGMNDELEQTSFKHITHIGIVYDIVNNTPIIIECTSSGTYSNGCIGRCGIVKSPFATSSGSEKMLGDLGITRGAGLTNRVVMAARHPAAFGLEENVPIRFEVYK